MRFVLTDGRSRDFIALCRCLDDCLNGIAGGEAKRSEYIRYNSTEDIRDVVLAYDGGEAIGCAADDQS